MGIFNLPDLKGHNKRDSDSKRPTPQSQRGIRLALGFGTVLILSFLLSIHLIPSKVTVQIGDISPEEIRAHKNVRRYVDTAETDRLRQEAASRVDKQYRDVPNAASDATESVTNFFAVLNRARSDSRFSTPASRIAFVRSNIRVELTDDGLAAVLSLDSHTFLQIENYTVQLVRDIMGREIRDDNNDAETARAEFQRRMANYLGSEKYAAIATQFAKRYITSNRIFDPVETDKLKTKKRQAVPAQYRQISTGEVILEKGEHVTREHIDKLTALGLSNPQVDYVTVLCITLLVACGVGFIVFYLARFHPRLYKYDKLLLLLALIAVINVFGLKLGGSMLGIKLSGLQFGYFSMSWTATAGMLAAILLDPLVAVMVVLFLATVSGVAMNYELRWALASILTALVGIYAVSDIRHRSDLVRAALAVCAANLAVVWVIGRVCGDEVSDMLLGSTWALAGGVISIMLFALGTAVLEKPFGITTHNRLIELSDTNNPMLKRLLMEAPGTYSHSIYVGNIASMAADVIGADALLVRVASYYHDIGKIRRAHFFVENQHVENVHDRLNPSLSALVIRSHIKDGLDLAREYRLPPLLCELMCQHHGTSLVRYFYSQAALSAAGGSTALEQQFRYEGTKPQTKEAALLMLADAVEAASRTLLRPTPGQIEDLVDGIIGDKLSDGQLDESELTFKDISRIRDSFNRTLLSMMHSRIEYPELPGSEGKKAIANGSSSKESVPGSGGSEKTDRGRQEISAG